MASSGGRTGRNVYLAAIEPGSGKSGEVRRRLPGTVGDEPAYAMPEVAMLDAPTVAEVAHALSARFLRPRDGAAAANAHFGTMMVHAGLAGGMVSGWPHTTTHTTRPAFEVIRTTSGVSIGQTCRSRGRSSMTRRSTRRWRGSSSVWATRGAGLLPYLPSSGSSTATSACGSGHPHDATPRRRPTPASPGCAPAHRRPPRARPTTAARWGSIQ